MSLDTISRKELQALAKEHGLKANGKSDELISQLKDVLGGPKTATRLSPGVARPGSGIKSQRSPALRGPSPARAAQVIPSFAVPTFAIVAHEAAVAEEEPILIRTKSLLQSPGYQRRSSAAFPDAGRLLFANSATAANEEEEEDGDEEVAFVDPRRGACRALSRLSPTRLPLSLAPSSHACPTRSPALATVELIRQKVAARKVASRAHRTTRADAGKTKGDKKIFLTRPTQPKVAHRCPGMHLDGARAAPPAETPKPATASTPKEKKKPAVSVLERSPFVALKSERKLTEPMEFNFSVGVDTKKQKSLHLVQARPVALRVAEKKRREEEAKALEKARLREENRRRIFAHHQQFAAATGIGPERKPLGPTSANVLDQPDAKAAQPSSSKAVPPRVGVKAAASVEVRRKQKVDKFACDSKARRNAKTMASRGIC
ncbi:hypothetical protein T492DRAFT_889253 [Pavlovales sp. CCMP2436]|nr:hypothetical protein T492DRAFT_889253 [Pavlovales sp. CCMP2436]